MNNRIWRIRLSVLWIANLFALTTGFVFLMFTPGFVEDLVSGMMNGEPLDVTNVLFMLIFWIVPIVMMYLSLAIGRSILRWLTIVFGILFGLLHLTEFISQIISFTSNMIAVIIIGLLLTIISFLIAWLGWKWPQENE